MSASTPPISPNLDPASTSPVSLDTLLEQIQHESAKEQNLSPIVPDRADGSGGLSQGNGNGSPNLNPNGNGRLTISNGNYTAHIRSQLTATPHVAAAPSVPAAPAASVAPPVATAQSPAPGLSEIPVSPLNAQGETPLSDRQELWESRLTDRQKALPKISYRMLGSVVAILLLVFGVGSATILTQENQDIRNQAFEQTLAPVSGPSAALTQQEIEQQQRLAQAGVVDTTVQRVQEQIAGFELTSTNFAILAAGGLTIFVVLAFLAWMSF